MSQEIFRNPRTTHSNALAEGFKNFLGDSSPGAFLGWLIQTGILQVGQTVDNALDPTHINAPNWKALITNAINASPFSWENHPILLGLGINLANLVGIFGGAWAGQKAIEAKTKVGRKPRNSPLAGLWHGAILIEFACLGQAITKTVTHFDDLIRLNTATFNHNPEFTLGGVLVVTGGISSVIDNFKPKKDGTPSLREIVVPGLTMGAAITGFILVPSELKPIAAGWVAASVGNFVETMTELNRPQSTSSEGNL